VRILTAVDTAISEHYIHQEDCTQSPPRAKAPRRGHVATAARSEMYTAATIVAAAATPNAAAASSFAATRSAAVQERSNPVPMPTPVPFLFAPTAASSMPSISQAPIYGLPTAPLAIRTAVTGYAAPISSHLPLPLPPAYKEPERDSFLDVGYRHGNELGGDGLLPGVPEFSLLAFGQGETGLVLPTTDDVASGLPFATTHQVDAMAARSEAKTSSATATPASDSGTTIASDASPSSGPIADEIV
jgi:hypothetical protein